MGLKLILAQQPQAYRKASNGRLEVRAWFVARTELFYMQPKSLCVDKAVITNHHIEQCNTGLLTRDPVCLSRHNLAAMLALISHNADISAKGVPPGANAADD